MFLAKLQFSGEKCLEIDENFPGKVHFEIVGKVPLLEYSIISILSGGAGLQSTGSNVIKNELLTKFIREVWKMSKKFQKKIFNGVLF